MEQKPIKNFGTGSYGRTEGLSKIFSSPMYTAHRAVIFAIAQLYCSSYRKAGKCGAKMQGC